MFHQNVIEKSQEYFASQSEPKCSEMQTLHNLVIQVFPSCRLWFDDGKNDENKIVANPTIGYGFQNIRYANGKTREFFQIGLSANTTGISVYVLGFEDKKYLAQTYGKDLGKASVTGYCIKFKSLKEINLDVLKAAIRDGFEHANPS